MCGQSRKALASEVRKVRPLKATDAKWEDFKLVKPERVRQWVAEDTTRLRGALHNDNSIRKSE